jgi:co-chaperonin GroES (HSP10)
MAEYSAKGTIRPTLTRIMVKPDETPETQGKVFIPEDYRDKAFFGTVIKCGPGRHDKDTGKWRDCMVKPGDRVMWNPPTRECQYSIGHEVEDDTGIYLLMNDHDVMGVVCE